METTIKIGEKLTSKTGVDEVMIVVVVQKVQMLNAVLSIIGPWCSLWASRNANENRKYPKKRKTNGGSDGAARCDDVKHEEEAVCG